MIDDFALNRFNIKYIILVGPRTLIMWLHPMLFNAQFVYRVFVYNLYMMEHYLVNM